MLSFSLIEQKIDGRALKLLAKEGSTDQLAACGLETVGDQLRLKEVASLVQMPKIIIRGKKTGHQTSESNV